MKGAFASKGRARLSRVCCAVALLAPLTALADPADFGNAGAVSGSVYLTPETLALQEDDFLNPAMFWVEEGERLFTADCAACHQGGLAGVAATFPKVVDGALRGIEAQINACRTDHLAQAPLDYDSDALIALSAYIGHLSRGLPQNPDISDPVASDALARGQSYFQTRRGQMDLSCADCHDRAVGKHLRAETITQGQVNGFPLYRQQWQDMGTVQRVFAWCNTNIRAEPLAYDDPDYVALELYLRWRGRGLPLETPAIRR